VERAGEEDGRRGVVGTGRAGGGQREPWPTAAWQSEAGGGWGKADGGEVATGGRLRPARRL